MPVRIVLVEDKQNIRDSVRYALEQEGHQVAAYADGEQAWKALERRLPDLLILDILLPRLDGLELCRRVRARSESVPLMFLTSRDEEFNRVLGLELGADDYLCKPFSVRELCARVKVLLRRGARRESEEPRHPAGAAHSHLRPLLQLPSDGRLPAAGAAKAQNPRLEHPVLGLAIVKAIVERYGGEVRACNREGGGAVFEVRLPAD